MNRKLIPVSVEGAGGSLCETACDGACCHAGVSIALHPDEAIKMRELYGAELEKEGEDNFLGYGSYRFKKDCPNLTVTEQMGVCAVWGDSGWSPNICGDFQAGSQACNFIRTDGHFESER